MKACEYVRIACVAAVLTVAAYDAQAADSKKTHKAVPAPQVSSKNLPMRTTKEDTKKLEAILLDKDEEAVELVEQKPIAASESQPVSQEELEQFAAPEDKGFMHETLMKIRVSAIRWRDVIEIFFAGIIAIYVRKLYRLSREQQKILSHAIRSAEYAAASAKRSSEICEHLLQDHKKPDEAQGKLDLEL